MHHHLHRLWQLLGVTGLVMLAPPVMAAPVAAGPTVVYATYVGGKGATDAEGIAVAVDAGGDAYVLETTTAHLTVTAIRLSKLSPSGTRLYTTTVSGPCGGQAGGLALDRAGNVYVTGLSLAKDPYGVCDLKQVLVAKLTPTGTPVYSLRFGQPDTFSTDAGYAIAVDRQGNAYVTGEANLDPHFPSTPGAMQTTPSTVSSAFVLTVDPAGRLRYSTFLGKDETTKGLAIAVDGQGEAYVGGVTTSAAFPTSPNAVEQRAHLPTAHLMVLGTPFVAKLNATGSRLLYATYLGTDGSDFLKAIALDAAGDVYVAGQTDNLHFPVTATAFSHAINPGLLPACSLSATSCAGITDAFLAEINPDPRLPGPRTLVYATYFGGPSLESAQGVAVDAARHVFLTGSTGSIATFPLVAATQPQPGAGPNRATGTLDAFVAEFDPARPGRAGLLFSTYLGGSAGDVGNGIARDGAANVYVTGTTASADFPTHAASGSLSGSNDAVLVKINLGHRGA